MSATPIPQDVRKALGTYLAREGLGQDSADGLLDALAQDLADGVPGSDGIYDRLVRAATDAAGARIEGLVREVAELASIPVAPETD